MLDQLERFLLKEKPVLAILAFRDTERSYAALIAKSIDSTVPHTSSILSELEAHGLIKSWPEGRIRYLELTDHGKIVVKALGELVDLLKKPDAKVRRLGQIKQMVDSVEGVNTAFKLGPLRRDLAKLKNQADDDLRRTILDLDARIVEALRK